MEGKTATFLPQLRRQDQTHAQNLPGHREAVRGRVLWTRFFQGLLPNIRALRGDGETAGKKQTRPIVNLYI
jgi:hypothetical protein